MDDKRMALQEQVIEETVAEALEIYGHLLAPRDRELARQIVGDVLATHPVTSDLLSFIVPPTPIEHSDTLSKDDGSDVDDEAAAGGHHE